MSGRAYYLHQGIYAYRREFLLQLASWPPTPLEQSEKLEQLRVLEHGRSIDVIMTRRAVHGIDTPEQYAANLSTAQRMSRQRTSMNHEQRRTAFKIGQSTEETEFYTPMPRAIARGITSTSSSSAPS